MFPRLPLFGELRPYGAALVCGIAGYSLKPGAKIRSVELQIFTDSLLQEIDNRGGDATGFIARTREGAWILEKAACDTREFLKERKMLPMGVQSVLLHTRFATQGHQAFMENNHPIGSGKMYITHNGHITNDDELVEKFGFPRLGRVDSEAIAHVFRAKGLNSASKAMEKIEGAAAIAVMDIDSGEIVIARGYHSPLIFVETSTMYVWASTSESILKSWSRAFGTPPKATRFRYIQEGTSIKIMPDGRKIEENFKAYEPSYSGYSSYTGSSWNREWEEEHEWKVVEKNGHTYWFKQPKQVEMKELTAGGISDPGAEVEMYKDCDACDEEFLEGELFEIYPGCSVCADCEKHITDGLFSEDDQENIAKIDSNDEDER